MFRSSLYCHRYRAIFRVCFAFGAPPPPPLRMGATQGGQNKKQNKIVFLLFDFVVCFFWWEGGQGAPPSSGRGESEAGEGGVEAGVRLSPRSPAARPSPSASRPSTRTPPPGPPTTISALAPASPPVSRPCSPVLQSSAKARRRGRGGRAGARSPLLIFVIRENKCFDLFFVFLIYFFINRKKVWSGVDPPPSPHSSRALLFLSVCV